MKRQKSIWRSRTPTPDGSRTGSIALHLRMLRRNDKIVFCNPMVKMYNGTMVHDNGTMVHDNGTMVHDGWSYNGATTRCSANALMLFAPCSGLVSPDVICTMFRPGEPRCRKQKLSKNNKSVSRLPKLKDNKNNDLDSALHTKSVHY